MRPPLDRRYGRTHVWVRPGDAGDVRLGLTHVPGQFLGDAVYIELPAPGTDVRAGEPIGLVESSSAVFEVIAPVSGTVVEVNQGVESSPEKVTAEPFGEGWLITLRSVPPGSLDALLTGEEYERLAGEE